MNTQQRQANILLKILLPLALFIIPIGTLLFLYSSYQSYEEPITWYEVILIPLNLFIMVFSVAVFFVIIWLFRHDIPGGPNTKD